MTAFSAPTRRRSSSRTHCATCKPPVWPKASRSPRSPRWLGHNSIEVILQIYGHLIPYFVPGRRACSRRAARARGRCRSARLSGRPARQGTPARQKPALGRCVLTEEITRNRNDRRYARTPRIRPRHDAGKHSEAHWVGEVLPSLRVARRSPLVPPIRSAVLLGTLMVHRGPRQWLAQRGRSGAIAAAQNDAESVLIPRRPTRYLPAETVHQSTTTRIYEGTNQIQRMSWPASCSSNIAACLNNISRHALRGSFHVYEKLPIVVIFCLFCRFSNGSYFTQCFALGCQ